MTSGTGLEEGRFAIKSREVKRRWKNVKSVERKQVMQSYFTAENCVEIVMKSWRVFISDDFLNDVKHMREQIKGAGLERVVVVDLTRVEIGMPVVRVIVPGLEMYAVDGDRIGRRCKNARSGRVHRTKS